MCRVRYRRLERCRCRNDARPLSRTRRRRWSSALLGDPIVLLDGQFQREGGREFLIGMGWAFCRASGQHPVSEGVERRRSIRVVDHCAGAADDGGAIVCGVIECSLGDDQPVEHEGAEDDGCTVGDVA